MREAFYEACGRRWPGTLFEAYDLLATRIAEPSEIEAIWTAASAVAVIYERTLRLIERAPAQLLLALGMTREVVNVLMHVPSWSSFPIIARLDLVAIEGVYKMLEINCDSPGLLVETFAVNAAACAFESLENPNASGPARLAQAYGDAVEGCSGNGTAKPPNTVIAYSASMSGDRDAAIYLSDLLTASGTPARAAALSEMVGNDAGIYDACGRTVDALINVFPLRYLFRGGVRRSLDGRPLDATMWSRLIAQRQVTIVNPLSSCVLESKAVQALIWELYEAHEYFTETERALIASHMLPTYLEPDPSGSFVLKPAFGSGGDSVVVSDGTRRFTSSGSTYAEGHMVYQQLVPVPNTVVATEAGVMELNAVASCYLVSQAPAGVIFRYGTGITNNSWWVVPVATAQGAGA